MEVLMEASRAGAEAGVVMMIAVTGAIVTAQMTLPDGMEIIIEVVAEPAHVLGAQIETRGAHEEVAAIVMLMRDQGTIAANEITAVKARVQREKGLPH
jgi:hypothetical protein